MNIFLNRKMSRTIPRLRRSKGGKITVGLKK